MVGFTIMTRRILGYRAALQWLHDNDDTDWLGDDVADCTPISVTALLVADIYDRATDEVTADLIRLKKKEAENAEQNSPR